MGASFTRLLKDHKILPVILTSLSIVFILGTVALVQQQDRKFALNSRASETAGSGPSISGISCNSNTKQITLTIKDNYPNSGDRDIQFGLGPVTHSSLRDWCDSYYSQDSTQIKGDGQRVLCGRWDWDDEAGKSHTKTINFTGLNTTNFNGVIQNSLKFVARSHKQHGGGQADSQSPWSQAEINCAPPVVVAPPSPTPDPSDYGSRGKFCKPTGDCNSGLVCQRVNEVFYCVLNNKSIANDQICYANSECRSGNCVQSGFGGGFCRAAGTNPTSVPGGKDGGSSACAQQGGSCKDNATSCSGHFEAGLCPGAANIQCCLPGSGNDNGGGGGGGNPAAPVCPAIAAPGVGITADHYAARNGALEWKAVAGAVKYLLRVEDPADSTVHTDVCGKPAGNDLKGDECVDVPSTKHGYVFQAGRAVRWWVHAVNSCGNVSVSTPQQILRIACGLANEPCCDTSRTSDKCDTTKKLVCSAGKCITSGSTTQPTATPTPTKSPTSSQKGDINLTLKLKFQGVIAKPNSADPIEVKVIIDTGKTAAHKVQFTPDENGVWTGTTTYSNVILGSGYSIFVKGPKHLQKKICTVTPSDKDLPGSYSCDDSAITLKAGDNSLDFSGIYLLVGDLPSQDGVVTAYDTSYIRQHLTSKDPEVLAIADLNYDGIVDTQDLSLVIQALNVKYDEAVK